MFGAAPLMRVQPSWYYWLRSASAAVKTPIADPAPAQRVYRGLRRQEVHHATSTGVDPEEH